MLEILTKNDLQFPKAGVHCINKYVWAEQWTDSFRGHSLFLRIIRKAKVFVMVQSKHTHIHAYTKRNSSQMEWAQPKKAKHSRDRAKILSLDCIIIHILKRPSSFFSLKFNIKDRAVLTKKETTTATTTTMTRNKTQKYN